MGKSVYIAEKPSVAQEFAKALHVNFKRKSYVFDEKNMKIIYFLLKYVILK